MRLFHILIPLSLALGSACGPTTTDDNASQQAEMPPLPASGTVHNKIPVTADSSQHYALYLPTTHAPGKHLPIVLFFDPQGQGGIPVRRYAPVAERHGFILAGSLNSKNGQEFLQSRSIHNKLWAEVLTRYTPDTARVVLAGFSGGARLAGTLAQHGERAHTVICVGGSYDHNGSDRFNVVVITGLGDFNYDEVIAFDGALNLEQARQVLTFEGAHEWPPRSTMEQALRFVRLQQMAKGLCPMDQAVIDSTKAEAVRLCQGKGNLERHQALLRACYHLRGLPGEDSLCNAAAEISNSDEVIADVVQHTIDYRSKASITERFTQHFMDWPLETWRKEIGLVHRAAEAGGREAWVPRRSLGHLSLVCYMNCVAAMADPSATPMADRFISLYRLIDPGNAEHAVMRAQWLARKGEHATAMQSLREAEQLGFRDGARLRGAVEFQPMVQDSAFQGLVGRLDALPEPQ